MLRRRDVLLIKLGALGDVVRTTGLLRPLAKRYDPCRLWWVTSARARPLLETFPLHARIDIEEAEASRDLERRFDLVISLDEDPRACRLAARLSASRLIGAYAREDGTPGYTPDSAAIFGMGLLGRDAGGSMAGADRLKRANLKTYQRLWAEILDLDLSDYPLGYRPPPGERARAGPSPALVGVNPGAGWPSKRLSPGKTVEILRALRDAGLVPALLGGPEDAAERAEVLKRAADAAPLDASTADLAAFSEAIAGCRVVITTDSLCLHLAASRGVPCVAVFGPTSDAEIELFGRGVKLRAGACACFYRRACAENGGCVDRIPTRAIVAAARRLLPPGAGGSGKDGVGQAALLGLEEPVARGG